MLGSALMILISIPFIVAVLPTFSSAGYDDPKAESFKVANILETKFSVNSPWVIAYLEFKESVDSDNSTKIAKAYLEKIDALEGVSSIQSYWQTPDLSLKSLDNRIGMVLIYLNGKQLDNKIYLTDKIKKIKAGEGSITYYTGQGPITNEINSTVKKDLLRAELFAIPLSILMTFFVFGSLVAAGAPLIVSLFAIPLSLGALWFVQLFTDLSVFGLNIITGLGLGLGIDYALLIVYRFREELAKGKDRASAIQTTIATAGKTVLYSGLTVALTMFSLSFFPLFFLQTFAWAGIAIVLLSVLGAVTLLPAMLFLLGAKIDSGFTIKKITTAVPDKGLWRSISYFVMKRSIPVALLASFFLILLALPAKDIIAGQPDERILPATNPVVLASDISRDRFNPNSLSNVEIILPSNSILSSNQISSILSIKGVTSVKTNKAIYVLNAEPTSNPNPANYLTSNYQRVTVYTALESNSSGANTLAKEVKTTIDMPEALYGGSIWEFKDSVSSIVNSLPKAITWIVMITFILLLLFTKSLFLPLKAVLLNALSLFATFGVLKLVFQDGLFNQFLGDFFVKGSLEISQLVLIVVIVFGLSMDYELFLLSRIKELHDQGMSTESAVALGLQRSGRIITAAAAILAFVFGAFVSSDVTSVKMMGFGIAFAILLDATVVRALLVPSLIKIAGDWNWYFPKLLKKLLSKIDTNH